MIDKSVRPLLLVMTNAGLRKELFSQTETLVNLLSARVVVRSRNHLPMPYWFTTLKTLFVCLLLGSGLFGYAQCPPRPANLFTGAMRTTATHGCVPFRVETSNVMIDVENVRQIFEYDRNRPNNPTTTQTSYTYKKPGIYYLVQYSEKQGLSMMSCAEIWVYDTLQPQVELSACGTRASLTITDPFRSPMKYDYFLVSWDDGKTDTVSTTPLRAEHTYANTDPRRIRVQGIHRFGRCGGTTALSFTPNQPASIRAVGPGERTGDGRETARVQIQNPGSLPLSLQQRVGNGAYGSGRGVPSGTSVEVVVPVDTGQTTCFRLVPGSVCPGYEPSAEVCYRPPSAKPAAEPISAFYLPDAFSPNNDGLNETFGLIGTSTAYSFTLTIFDRWGHAVFTTDDPKQAWNGLINGQLAPPGSYAYELRSNSPSGSVTQKSGRVLLVR
ncbi:gliding motility-associated C-terminal domain-containing protein [Spirosoma montaniterrae]|uniref:PKD domain-containing protein n=1 Tax=Spirosoma montaniterrae TaxID=1178516 RepID=A0A1P9WUW9_9BACT|nr:gliding motility-associated C-terminal domain-containing protein [Spirosoma montaniterrae]AQG79177.1 hypothetical protein AWR27_07475 [Spirosoma montaniterrae]